MTAPCQWSGAEKSGVALLVRHAERPEIPPGSFGHDLPITTAGRRRSQELGDALGPRLGRVLSSGVPRCIQTATAIVRGSGVDRKIETDRRLGDPGAWIADSRLAGEVFLDRGSSEVVRLQLQADVPGMHSLSAGAAAILACLLVPPPASGVVDVFVSHDAVMAPLLGHLLGTDDFGVIWPGYLEGARFTRSVRGVGLRWRDEVLTLGREVLHAP